MARIKCSANMNAFLDMISFSEGTQIAGSDDGYDVLVGGTLFVNYSRHPHVMINLPKLGIKSSAAGRYQILGKYADHYINILGLPDFGPESQDRIALQLIRECIATQLVERGYIRDAIHECNSRWASFPGNNYGQHQNSIDKLIKFYEAAGGKL